MANPWRSDRARILRYWWMLELFDPQPVPKLTGRSQRPQRRQVVEWHPGDPLPWQTLPVPAPRGHKRSVWRHTVYLGVYDLEDVYRFLHRVFADDRDAYDQRRAGVSACAAVQVDEHGRLVESSAALSSALWAVAQISSTGAAPDLHWASGFNSANTAFGEQVDMAEGLRRDAVGADAPLPQDSGSLQRLLGIAYGAAGIGGNDPLCSSRVVISSTLVTEGRGDAGDVDTDFLNSFFLTELATVQRDLERGYCPKALADYLTPDRSVPVSGRTDVIRWNGAVDSVVGADRLPLGRWPSEPAHPLTLRQQFAVNRALDSLAVEGGIMGVNGPPGTGKTTMLRDILAGNVVERARRLADLDQPEQAFTATVHRWNSQDGYARRVRQLRPELTGLEMVVVSANNAAVENISVEIPAREAIASRWRDEADYFADIATAVMADDARAADAERQEAWGLVAARLGSKRNRGAFRSAFWFDQQNRKTRMPLPGGTRMQTRLKQWRDGEVPHVSWHEARARFRRAERRVEELISRRRAAQERWERLRPALKKEAELAGQARQLADEAAAANLQTHDYEAVVQRALAERSEAEQARQRQLESRPGVLETIFTFGRAIRQWRSRMEPLDDRLQEAEQNWREVSEQARRLADWARGLSSRQAVAEESWKQAARDVAELRRRVAADEADYGRAYPYRTRDRVEREMRAPWLDESLDAARAELFLAALRLHEDFLANAAGDMLEGLRAAIDVVGGDSPRDLEPEKIQAAWQTFFLVVPLVSTTFASFGRMFAGLGAESLGWLLIDEAGQACPQHAVGAIWRAQRVVAVGDPLQLQPVVTMPRKATRDIAKGCGVSETWIPPEASVQSLADRISRYGTTLGRGGDQVWVSAPLTVHRRCDDPMFSLCNAIAYDGIMISGVHRRLDDPGSPDLFDGPEGPRICSSRWFDVPAAQRGTHLQGREINCLGEQIDALIGWGVDPAQIIAISPFREVADRLRSVAAARGIMSGGTIHTAQGREADVVFLVLGGDPGAPGAKAWAAATVNLVNVAASRARRRLYVIGDRAAWMRYPYFRDLGEALDSQPGMTDRS
ncbi:DEAD/DEAH box helicase [Actinomyces sp. MRS3W]|uniref:DEAD/DEAH box helicase n=1 Tax=Actinomyces sp. MRS3W TaxID=2800796 RepID=UPI0028FD603D|nr:AAA domain-containing protein [Actinomyces sp. MRS3W]MDU0348050.1 AAA domain-containing protein [Actinomyces sp. MRS3W]